jgi:hypothetical protein
MEKPQWAEAAPQTYLSDSWAARMQRRGAALPNQVLHDKKSPNSVRRDANVLPAGWQEFESDEGQRYYYHEASGRSVWDLAEVHVDVDPAEAALAEEATRVLPDGDDAGDHNLDLTPHQLLEESQEQEEEVTASTRRRFEMDIKNAEKNLCQRVYRKILHPPQAVTQTERIPAPWWRLVLSAVLVILINILNLYFLVHYVFLMEALVTALFGMLFWVPFSLVLHWKFYKHKSTRYLVMWGWLWTLLVPQAWDLSDLGSRSTEFLSLEEHWVIWGFMGAVLTLPLFLLWYVHACFSWPVSKVVRCVKSSLGLLCSVQAPFT